MYDDLKIIAWPDPRLTRPNKPVELFDENLAALAARMITLMREAKGVGLAAPQVAQNVRLFVMNPTGEPADARIYVNPQLSEAEGEEEGEEGCLSLPGINVNVVRHRSVRIDALDLSGKPIAEHAAGYIARIWQHEFDHLNGTLLLDRMGPVAKLTNRRTIGEMKARYAAEHPAPPPRKAKVAAKG